MWEIFDNHGRFYHKSDSFALADNLAWWMRGSCKWNPKATN